MATWDLGLSSGGILRVIANQGTQDIPNNRSICNASLYVINNTSSEGRWANGSWAWSIRSPNATVQNSGSGSNYTFAAWEAKLFGTASFWNTHNADGTLTKQVTGHFADIPTYGWWGSGSTGGNITYTRIPRGPRVKSAGTWRQTVAYVKSGGTWKIAIPYTKSGGVWRIGGG